MASKSCRVIVCPPYAEPAAATWVLEGADGAYPYLDRTIPGYYEYVWLYRKNGASVCIFFSGDGRKRKLPANRWGLVGPLVVMKLDKDGHEAGLSDEELALSLDALRDPDWLKRTRPDPAAADLQK